MPLIFHHNLNNFQISLWKICEEESFYAEKISYKPEAKNNEKRIQQFAARYLLELMNPNFPFDQVVKNNSGKPGFASGKINFSLSHCTGYAASIISYNKLVGIDVEIVSDRVLKIEHKFLNDPELEMLSVLSDSDRTIFATLFWSIKETVYKWWGRGNVDFSEHIKIQPTNLKSGKIKVNFLHTPNNMLEVECMLINDIWITHICQLPE